MLASLNSKIFRMQTRSSEGGDPLIYIYIYREREREISLSLSLTYIYNQTSGAWDIKLYSPLICKMYQNRHQWSSGRIVPCHGTDPGSIPGWCIWFLYMFSMWFQLFPSRWSWLLIIALNWANSFPYHPCPHHLSLLISTFRIWISNSVLP